jgi:hypothetical protein
VVARGEVAYAVEVRAVLLEQVGHLGEMALEPRRSDDLDEPGRRWPSVPERVRDSARLDHVAPGARLENSVTHPNPERALEHVRQFVLVGVDVRGARLPGRTGCSTIENAPPVAAGGTLKHTPIPPSATAAPASGPSIMGWRATVMVLLSGADKGLTTPEAVTLMARLVEQAAARDRPAPGSGTVQVGRPATH